MNKKILGLDLGSNSIGWALLETEQEKPCRIIDVGSRIFNKAVEEKTPTPKNAKRRDRRLARRVLQRRARRKQRMINYLVKLELLPIEILNTYQPEIILNALGNPYKLRAKALDNRLTKYELGRVFLHLVQRRGFLSNRKTLLGDLADDPDVQSVLAELEDHDDTFGEQVKEETLFKKDISELREVIEKSQCRTLGEYLANLDHHSIKRNRSREGGHLRTDRQMYRDELNSIWQQQSKYHSVLNDKVKQQIKEIIFRQRPLKLRSDRVGKCSLEPKNNRARIARLEAQRFRYLQDINNLQFFHPQTDRWTSLSNLERKQLIELFETGPKVNLTIIKKVIGLGNRIKLNLESKNIKSNTTAVKIRVVLPEWDDYDDAKKYALVEDLITINKKSVLKKRLISHWKYDTLTAVNLTMLEFEPGHSNLSSKAIKKLLPYLRQGQIYSEARISAGYDYEVRKVEPINKLDSPPETSNPIVNKGLHELKRLVNAIIAEYGKPDVIRIEMARDLEMNTKRYKAFTSQQNKNKKANEEATEKYRGMTSKNPHLQLSEYPSRDDKIRYRLWKDQEEKCAYSGKQINLSTLFSAEIDVDHIIPYSQSLDDSYMNKVVCYASENRYKGQRTPIDAFGGNEERWNQITQALQRWDKKLESKVSRFYMTEEDVIKRDFVNSQLNDTRYISRLAHDYIKSLGVEVNVTKGFLVSWLRHQWGLDELLGESDKKERNDHRHHTIDAVVIACIDRGFHQRLARIAKQTELKSPEFKVRDLYIPEPWDAIRNDVQNKLKEIIVSHDSQRKISGALHEETGSSYNEKAGGTVYRVDLDGDFKTTQVKKIIDDQVREIVTDHLARFDNKPKQAFAEGITVYHKDGKTPIRRVRILQSKSTLDKLKKSKFGVRNKQGQVFKWMSYGNTHHVEILKHRQTGQVAGKFVSAMEASHRIKGIGMPKQSVVQINHGDDYEFLIALHINDMVSCVKNGKREFYRVQKLDTNSNRFMLRYHAAATLDDKSQEIYCSINQNLFDKWKLVKHTVNTIGKLL